MSNRIQRNVFSSKLWRVRLRIAAMFCSLFLLSGCGGHNFPRTVTVAGIVTLGGQPVEGAEVVFTPAGEGGHAAKGTTNAAGSFTLSTYFSPDHQPAGAVPGEYNVGIQKLEIREQVVGTEGYRPPKHLLPERYANPAGSGLSATINSGGARDLKFELTEP